MSYKKIQSRDRLDLGFKDLSDTTWSSNNRFRQALFIVILGSFALCSYLLFQFDRVQNAKILNDKFAPQSLVQSPALLEIGQANIGLPMRLKIPAINVDAAIEYVGLNPDGAMGVPTKLVDAAWYNLGPRPGQKGNAVIDGHRSSRTWVPAVFDHLDDIRIGDNLYVEDDQGSNISFVVRETRLYYPDEDASDIFSLSDGIHLNLISCSGDWDIVQKSFNKRLVIFADIVI